MEIVKPKLSLKLSLKKETLRVLNDSDLSLLDAVVGGTGCGSTCGATCGVTCGATGGGGEEQQQL